MGRISHRPLNSALEQNIYLVFCEHLANLKTPSDVREFLESLLSKTEQIMLMKRLAIVILLSRGYTYDQIKDTLKVSKSTITTVHRELLIGAKGYERAIVDAKNRKSKKQVWSDLEEAFKDIIISTHVGFTKKKLQHDFQNKSSDNEL